MYRAVTRYLFPIYSRFAQARIPVMARKTGSSNTGYSLEKRERKTGKPYWRVRIWVPDPETGEKKTRIVGTYPTKTEAHEAGREAVQQRDRGTLLNPSTVTVAELLDEWLLSKADTVSGNSLQDYEIAARRHIKPAIGGMKLQDLTPSQVRQQYAAWKDAGMSARMVHRCHIVLGQALAFAVHEELVFRNVAADVKKPSIQKTEMKVWNPDETRRFLHAAMHRPVLTRISAKPDATSKPVQTRPDDLLPLWYLLTLEGLRRGEALGLRWKDVNWDRGTIHVVQTVIADKSNKGTAIVQSRTKTKTGSRTVRLTPDTLDVLKTHRKEQTARRLASPEWVDNDLIVCTSKGTPVSPANVSRSFERLVALAGVPRIRVHDLRHTSATLLLRAGTAAKVVSERLGHASIGITLDTYSHVLPDMQDTAADAMSTIVNLKTTG